MSWIAIAVSDQGRLRLARQILADMPNALKRAIRNSAVDATRSIKADIPRLVGEPEGRYAITKAEVRKQMKVKTVSEQSGMVTGISVTGSRIPQMRFSVVPDAPPPQAGVAVRSRQLVSRMIVAGKAQIGTPNRFIARMQSGHVGVFRRVEGTKNKAGTGAKLDEEYRPSIPELTASKNIAPKIEKRASEVFVRALDRNIKAAVKKAKEK